MDNLKTQTKVQVLAKKGFFSYWAALISVIILPVNVWYLPPFMILWVLCWIGENYTGYQLIRNARSSHKVLFVLVAVFYAWEVIGLSYTEDVSLGMGNLFTRLSFLLFPLVLISPGEMIRARAKLLLRIFALSTFAYLFFCFCYAFFRSVTIQDGTLIFNPVPTEFPWLSYFYGAYLTINKHPSYIALYVLLSAIICFEAWFDYSLDLRRRVFWIILGILMIATLYFLSSRGGILIGLAVVLMYFIFRIGRLRKMKPVWIVILLVLIISSPLLVNNQRLNNIYSLVLSKQASDKSNRDPRLVIWRSALNTSRKNLMIGVGIGDGRKELASEYSRIGETKLAEERFNAHNQFLEVLIENGIIGLLVFISIITCMTYIAVSEKNLLYGLFILIVVMFFQFESILYRLPGVTFFSLFAFLLLYNSRGISPEEASPVSPPTS